MTSPSADEDLTRDGFLDGRLSLWQPKRGYRAGTDPVFLAAAVPARAGQSVLELGTGVGTAILCLSARVPGLTLSALELQPLYAGLARRNARAAGVKLDLFEGDLRSMPPDLRSRRFDHVMMNPPYFPADGRTPARDEGRETARGEGATLADWLDAGLRRLAPKGRLTLIQDAARLPAVLAHLSHRSGTIAVHPLAPRTGRAAMRVIVTASREGAAFTLAAPVVVHEGSAHVADGDSYARAARDVLRAGRAWPWVAD